METLGKILGISQILLTSQKDDRYLMRPVQTLRFPGSFCTCKADSRSFRYGITLFPATHRDGIEGKTWREICD